MQVGSALNTLNSINQHKTNSENILSKIGAARELSGKDNASLMISNSLNSQMSTFTQEIQNENDKIGMLQIADGALQNISDNTLKLEELSVRNNNAALNASQKNMLNSEFQATKKTIEDITSNTRYNGQSLFGESSPLQLSTIQTDKLSIDNQTTINDLKQQVDGLFSDVGSSMQNASSSVNTLLSSLTNATSSYANLSEEPMDVKISNLSASNTQLTASLIAQSHSTQLMQQQMGFLLQ